MNTKPDFQPLYEQVYVALVRRISSGDWQPGRVLPSETALASELGVSQGTVRKAMNTLTSEQLVARSQGRGSFMAQDTPEHALFRFLRFVRPLPGRKSAIRHTSCERVRRREANDMERSKLVLRNGSRVIELTRMRRIDFVPVIVEKIVLPLDLSSDIDRHKPLPNTLMTVV